MFTATPIHRRRRRRFCASFKRRREWGLVRARCFEAGVDIKAISEQLGHANVKTTYNIYVHLLEDTKEKEIDKLEGIDRLLA